MSVHIEAKKGDIAEIVLLPGDPLRAKFIAENLLENAVCYNEVRGMYGFTGTYKDTRVSVQGTGMGMPSISIYLNELISEYGANKLIRIGTCGSLQADIRLKQILLAMSASSDSHVNKLRFRGMDYSPTACFSLLKKAHDMASQTGTDVRVGPVLSTDSFYDDDPEAWKLWADYGVLAVEMETAALYTLAAKFKVEALSILTVSDSLPTGERASSGERQTTFTQMAEIALEVVRY
ncbi:purine-nucleoside phosphorylase [bacterium]|nr:purine-nucleoside phosphorylase [bacterium]